MIIQCWNGKVRLCHGETNLGKKWSTFLSWHLFVLQDHLNIYEDMELFYSTLPPVDWQQVVVELRSKLALLLCLLSSVCTVPLLNGPYGLWGSLQACIPQEVNLLWMIKHRANELHYHSGVSNTVWNIDSLVSAWMDSFLALFKKSHYIKSCAELSDHSKAYTTTTGPLSIQEVAWSKSNFCFL